MPTASGQMLLRHSEHPAPVPHALTCRHVRQRDVSCNPLLWFILIHGGKARRARDKIRLPHHPQLHRRESYASRRKNSAFPRWPDRKICIMLRILQNNRKRNCELAQRHDECSWPCASRHARLSDCREGKMRQMRAIRLVSYESTPCLAQIDAPNPGPRQLRVRVAACGLNFADLLMMQGTYQEKIVPPCTLGMELAGTVDAVGADVTAFTGRPRRGVRRARRAWPITRSVAPRAVCVCPMPCPLPRPPRSWSPTAHRTWRLRTARICNRAKRSSCWGQQAASG